MKALSRYALPAIALSPLLLSAWAIAQQGPSVADGTGAQLYENACAACHATSGRGRTQREVAFETPLPDFADCNFATREPDEDWLAIVDAGGSVRAFDEMMPAFGEALSDEQMRRILAHVRTFCADASWPRGELNLPRALFTEKAYPEDEAVLTVTAAVEGPSALTSEFIWERRLGARSQIEIGVPFAWNGATASQEREAGLGDVAIGFKHTLHHSLASGSILSAGIEVVAPTGDETRGLGSGTTVIEPFLSFGKLLLDSAFVHAQVLAEFPVEPDFEDEIGLRVAIGRSWTAGRFGRVYTPMLEVLGARELAGGADVEWDAVPQLQVTLNTRQHVIASLGVRVPLSDSAERDTVVALYVLWDWFDGGLLDGW